MKKHATLIIAFILGVLVGAGVTHTGEEDVGEEGAKVEEPEAAGTESDDPATGEDGGASIPGDEDGG